MSAPKPKQVHNWTSRAREEYRTPPGMKLIAKRREPGTHMRPAEEVMVPFREWIDCPKDRAEVAAILGRGRA